jgi:hypothetical protein
LDSWEWLSHTTQQQHNPSKHMIQHDLADRYMGNASGQTLKFGRFEWKFDFQDLGAVCAYLNKISANITGILIAHFSPSAQNDWHR